MPTFRVHIKDGRKHDIDAATADQARKIANGKNLGVVRKVKRLREAA